MNRIRNEHSKLNLFILVLFLHFPFCRYWDFCQLLSKITILSVFRQFYFPVDGSFHKGLGTTGIFSSLRISQLENMRFLQKKRKLSL